MIMISSPAGRRLARVKARLDEIVAAGETAPEEMVAEYERAADAVADELIADNFHKCEGD
jgi:hypothetical protein